MFVEFRYTLYISVCSLKKIPLSSINKKNISESLFLLIKMWSNFYLWSRAAVSLTLNNNKKKNDEVNGGCYWKSVLLAVGAPVRLSPWKMRFGPCVFSSNEKNEWEPGRRHSIEQARRRLWKGLRHDQRVCLHIVKFLRGVSATSRPLLSRELVHDSVFNIFSRKSVER